MLRAHTVCREGETLSPEQCKILVSSPDARSRRSFYVVKRRMKTRMPASINAGDVTFNCCR